MKPPICHICGKFIKSEEGGLVYFEKRERDLEWDKKASRPGFCGHPPYAEYFCQEHYALAKENSRLPIDEAMGILKSRIEE